MSAWLDRRILHMAALSIPSGIPLAVVLSTVPAFLADQKIQPSTIGLLSLASLPWSLKFAWAPVVDRVVPSFIGRRRGWMLLAQAVLTLGIACVPAVGATQVAALGALVLLIAAASATQDIALDAFAIETMRRDEHGPGNALRTTLYRVGMILAGGVAIASADQVSWQVVFLGIAFLMVLAMLLTWTAEEPEAPPAAPVSFRAAVLGPVSQFFARRDAWAIAAFILLYKFGDNMATSMLPTFFQQSLGVSKTEIGFLQKTLGISASIVGALAGGALLPRLGLSRALWIFGSAQAIANVSYALTAWTDGNRMVMYSAIALEQASAGMGTAALLTLITQLVAKEFAATQFALLTSLMGLGRSLAGVPSGYLVGWLGYPSFFLLCVGAAAPGLLALAWVNASRRPA